MAKELEKGQLWRLYTLGVIVPALTMIAFSGKLGKPEKIILYTISIGTFLSASIAYGYTKKMSDDVS